MPLKWYLHEVLKLPRERGLRSPTVSRGGVGGIERSDETWNRWHIFNSEGMRTEQCLLRIVARSWFRVLFKPGF